jgi:hypothetical protein
MSYQREFCRARSSHQLEPCTGSSAQMKNLSACRPQSSLIVISLHSERADTHSFAANANPVEPKSGATLKSGACQLKPKRDGTVESHPSAECAEGWGTHTKYRGSAAPPKIQCSPKSRATLKSGACQLEPKRDGTVESHPFDSAQGRLFRNVRGRMGHPRGRMGHPLGIRVQKQMRPGPATRAALLSRTFLTAVFRQGERASRNRTGKSAMHRCSP